MAEFQAGNLICIKGTKPAFDQTDEETGVFIKPQIGNAIRVNEYAKTDDNSILLKLPEKVKPGKNAIEVRSRKSDDTIINGVLIAPVKIAA